MNIETSPIYRNDKKGKRKKNRLKIICLLCFNILLQGCEFSSINGIFSNKNSNAYNHLLTPKEIDHLAEVIANNANLTEEGKAMISQFRQVLEVIPYINYEQVEQNLASLDIVEMDFEDDDYMQVEGYWLDSTNTIAIENWDVLSHELFHLLSGGNNGMFFEEGITSLAMWELQLQQRYPEHILITQMFCEMFGADFVLQSFMSQDNLLKEKVASVVDPEFANIFFRELDIYHTKYMNCKTEQELEETRKSLSVIIQFIDVIYKCNTNIELDSNSLLRDDLEEKELNQLHTMLNYRAQLLRLNSGKAVSQTEYFATEEQKELILKR